MLTPEACTAPETTHRLYEVQEINKTKQNKTKKSLYNKKTLTISCYILFSMYFMLIVTIKFSMHTIKPLKKSSTD